MARSSWLLVCSPWDGQRSLRAWLEVRFGVSKYADGKVLDMRGPLCCQLKELDVVPLHPVDQDPQHVLLMLRCANQPADSFNALALRLNLLVFCFLG